MTNEAVIHLRVPAALKGRWIRASRAQGEKLTDWIIAAVERDMARQLTRIAIPDDLSFADLNLRRESNGDVSFDTDVIRRICEASDVPPEAFLEAPEDNVSALIVRWYQAHRAAGGETNAVQEDLIAEMRAENAAGQPFSYPPGRA